MRTGKAMTSLCGSLSCLHIMSGSRRGLDPTLKSQVAIGFLRHTGMESPREPIRHKGRMALYEVR